MKHTRLIPIIIVAIMLFNCFMPLVSVTANTAALNQIALNSKLYEAIKEQLNEQKINAKYNDYERTISISNDELAKVTSLNLQDKGITNLKGIEKFSNLTNLDLSDNGLEAEDLEVLKDLNLKVLDLSSNNIESLESIETLVNNIIEESKKPESEYVLDISGQKFTKIEVISAPETDTIVDLPQIIKYAGELNVEEWISTPYLYEQGSNLGVIYADEYFTTDIFQQNGVAQIKINSTNQTESYDITRNKYLMELEINIPESAGTVIGGTTITLYYLVLDENERAAIFKDVNLYNLVKRQLTDGTNNINEDLRTDLVDDNETLYLKAYDKPMIMVFDIDTLINEIPSLKLESSKLKDLSGLETFVGLEKELNLYDNYIEELDKIIELQENKDKEEELLQQRFTKQAQTNKISVKSMLVKVVEADKKLEEKKAAIKAAKVAIENAQKAILEARAKIAELDSTEEAAIKAQNDIIIAQEKIIDEKNKLLKEAKTNEDGTITPSLYDQGIDAKQELDAAVELLMVEMEDLYSIYNDLYKTTSILSLEANTLTTEEFNKLGKIEGNLDSDVAFVTDLYNSIVEKIGRLEATKGLSQTEKDLIDSYLGLTWEENEERNYSSKLAIPEEWADLEKNQLLRAYQYRIEKLIEADAVAFLVNMMSIKFTYEDLEGTTAEELKQEVAEEIKEDLEEYILENRNTVRTKIVMETLELNSIQDLYAEDGELERRIIDYFNHFVDAVVYDSIVKEGFYANTDRNYSNNDYANYDDYVNYNQYAYTQLLGLAGKYATLTAEEIKAYVILPALRNINLEDNALESLEGIEKLPKLETLNAAHNQIFEFVTINGGNEETTGNVSGESFASNIRVIDLNYNFIDDLKPFESLKNLEELYVAKNRLSGEFKLDISKLKKLKIADFSYNKYSDIGKLIAQFRLAAASTPDPEDPSKKMSVGKYIRSVIDIKFHYQELSEDIGKITLKNGEEQIKKVDLTKVAPIFTQVEAIDSERLEFGTQGTYGAVKPDGTIGVTISSEEGKHNAFVTIDTKESYFENGECTLAHGTILTLNYESMKSKVDNVEFENNEETITTEVELGKTIQFKADINGTNVDDTSIIWSIERLNEEGNLVTTESTTNINENGLLTVDPNETAKIIRVTAISNYDNTKFATVEVKVVKLNTSVDIEQTATEKGLEQGATKAYTAIVTTEAEDKTVTWTIEGKTSENTKIDENGVLTIGEDEVVGTKIVIKATSNYDDTKFASVEETVIEKVKEVVVSINETATEKGLEQGATKTYTVTITTEAEDKTVTWSVEGNKSENTKIDANGALIIGKDEVIGTKITVKATSNYDNTKFAFVEETVVESKVELNKPTTETEVFEQTPGTTVNAFVEGLVDDGNTVKVVDKDGNEVSNTEKLATGMKVIVNDKTEYTLVVTGDINSDGKVDSLDSEMIKAARLGILGLTDIQEQAADINADGKVNRIDSFIMLLYRAGSREVRDFTAETIENIMK